MQCVVGCLFLFSIELAQEFPRWKLPNIFIFELYREFGFDIINLLSLTSKPIR